MTMVMTSTPATESPCWMPKYAIRHMQGDGSYIVHRGKLPSCDTYIYICIYIYTQKMTNHYYHQIAHDGELHELC